MKVIIAGSRSIILRPQEMDSIVNRSNFHITELVCGMAKGVDSCGWLWAKKHKIPIKSFPGGADPKGRNTKMAEYADALIAIWNMKSGGTFDVMQKAFERKLPVFYIEYTHANNWVGVIYPGPAVFCGT